MLCSQLIRLCKQFMKGKQYSLFKKLLIFKRKLYLEKRITFRLLILTLFSQRLHRKCFSSIRAKVFSELLFGNSNESTLNIKDAGLDQHNLRKYGLRCGCFPKNFPRRTRHCTKNKVFHYQISSVNVTKSIGNCGFGHIY